MKRINKNPEPKELIEWKKEDKKYKNGIPVWKRIPTEVKQKIRESLLSEQGYICCYCEGAITGDHYHIEHIQPKGVKASEHLLAEYDNLLASCLKDTVAGDPLHCGKAKKYWYDPQLYVSPLSDDCETKFSYGYDGTIAPAGEEPAAATATIQNLKLDLPKLNALRKAAIDPFLDEDLEASELKDYVTGYLAASPANGGRYNEYYSTIKHLFGQLI